MGKISRAALHYAVAIAIVGVAALVRWAFTGVLAPSLYLVFYPAVVLAAIIGGTGPGLVAAIGSALCVDVFFTAPYGRFSMRDLGDVVRILIFVAGGTGVSLVAGMNKAAQARERRRAAELADLAELTSLGNFLIRDEQDRILRWSEGCADLYGFTAEEAIGRISHELLQTRFPQPLEKIQETLLQTGRWEGELTQRSADDKIFTVASLWVLRRATESRPPMILEVNNDMTERKRAEQALRELNETLERRVAERTAEAERRLTQLRAITTELTLAEHRERQRIAKVLHDHLQQMLVGAKLSVAFVQSHTAEPRIRQSLDHLNGLLDDSLKASRSLTAELFPPVLREGTFAEALRWLIQWMGEKHDLQIQFRTDEQVNPQAEEIRLLLFEATRELLFNVVKHAGVREACLEMASHNGSQVRVTVADSGKGFDVTTLRPAERTEGGFGMATIRNRMRLLGGHIEIQSTPGCGTTATLLAPLQR